MLQLLHIESVSAPRCSDFSCPQDDSGIDYDDTTPTDNTVCTKGQCCKKDDETSIENVPESRYTQVSRYTFGRDSSE